jgi:hypothetical protein
MSRGFFFFSEGETRPAAKGDRRRDPPTRTPARTDRHDRTDERRNRLNILGNIVHNLQRCEKNVELRPPPHDADGEDCVRSWLRSSARSGPHSAYAWTNALPEASTVGRLKADAAKLMAMRRARVTFWLELTDTPRCALEQLAQGILQHQFLSLPSEAAERAKGACGAEWWVQHRRMDESIDLHWDNDESLRSSTGEHVPPLCATVTYLNDGGAPTLILPLAASKSGRCVHPHSGDPPAGAFLSYPRKGKHLAFDGRLLHGAPHLLAMPLAASDNAAPDGMRTTILVNIWLGHKPIGTSRLPEALAAACSPRLTTSDLLQLSPANVALPAEAEPPVSTAADPPPEVGYPFQRPTAAAALRMRRLPLPSAACHLLHVPAALLELESRDSSLSWSTSSSDMSSHQHQQQYVGDSAPAARDDAEAGGDDEGADGRYLRATDLLD